MSELTLSDMMSLLRKGLGGLDATDMTDVEATRLLNLSLWELTDRFPFKEKECIVTATTVVGQRSYAIPLSLDALISVAVYDKTSQQAHKLSRMGFDDFQELEDDNTTDEGIPTRYLRINAGLYLDPVPDDAYTIEMVIWRTITSLLSGTVDESGLPRNWDELVVEGAIVRGHFYNQDYNLARQAANFQIGKVRETINKTTKAERDSRYAGLQVLHEDPRGDGRLQ